MPSPTRRRHQTGLAGVGAWAFDEILSCSRGRFNKRGCSTSVVDVGRGQLHDVVPGRTAKEPACWLLERPSSWRAGVRWGTLDLPGPYRAAFEVALPDAQQVADPFHVVRLPNNALDETRRRVQYQPLQHRGHKHEPLNRARKTAARRS